MENEIKTEKDNVEDKAETKSKKSTQQDDQPIFTQGEVDQKCYVARTKAEAKSAKRIAELEIQIKELQTRPILEKALKDSGCKEKAIAMILQNNPALKELAYDHLALSKEIERLSLEYDYAFEKKPFVADPLANKQIEENEAAQKQLTQFQRFFGK